MDGRMNGVKADGSTHPLQALRGWLPSLVRTLHRYYTRVRLLARVPVGLLALAFSHRSAAGLRRRCGPGLPVLVHDVSGRARGLGVSAPVRVVFAVCYRIDTLDLFLSQLNTRPVHAPVYASPPASRLTVQDSGSGWVTTLSPETLPALNVSQALAGFRMSS